MNPEWKKADRSKRYQLVHEMLNKGISKNAIARRFGVSSYSILKVARGKRPNDLTWWEKAGLSRNRISSIESMLGGEDEIREFLASRPWDEAIRYLKNFGLRGFGADSEAKLIRYFGIAAPVKRSEISVRPDWKFDPWTGKRLKRL